MYRKGYNNMAKLSVGLAQYFAFYNGGWLHQAFGCATPDHVYRAGVGGGTHLVDKFGNEVRQHECRTGVCC